MKLPAVEQGKTVNFELTSEPGSKTFMDRSKELRMKKLLPALPLVAFLFVGCIVPGPRGSGAILVPALPAIVVLETEPYYQSGGYFYFYQNNSWSYSNSRSGPWVELPRDRYPKEVRFKGKREERGADEQRGRDRGGRR